ncbi:unnamed protein product [Brassica rapa]|uniref:Uncharacterized protein n=2 Tax=Brassica TaxID=3705 RepID=A0A3P5YCA3_BRACM|nr:unnamed protein product [Brassica napus]CAG7868124.1 unnamed protein product [Brassica rapa]CDY50964.1 BnaA06g37600D [Brassica napus]VDC65019.1 unnamed protein product [Brassica rapa]
MYTTTVNRSLGKLAFPCERVDARWGKLECEQKSCDLHGTSRHLICYEITTHFIYFFPAK